MMRNAVPALGALALSSLSMWAAVALAAEPAPPPTTSAPLAEPAPPAPEPLALVPSGPGFSLFMARCTTCHTNDLVLQQRLTLPQWEKVVAKMSAWGARLSDDQQKTLARYLARSLPADAPEVQPRLAPTPASASK